MYVCGHRCVWRGGGGEGGKWGLSAHLVNVFLEGAAAWAGKETGGLQRVALGQVWKGEIEDVILRRGGREGLGGGGVRRGCGGRWVGGGRGGGRGGEGTGVE